MSPSFLFKLGLLLLLPKLEVLKVPKSHEKQHVDDFVLDQLVGKRAVWLDLEVSLFSLPGGLI